MNKNMSGHTAILIDGESLAAALWDSISQAAAGFGNASVVRVFGDFANNSHAAWLSVCRDNGVEPVLHCPSVTGKNGADMMIAIAAMDLLHAGFSGTLVIASNDRDFLPLARRLRLSGIVVCCISTRAPNIAEASIFSSWTDIGLKKSKLDASETQLAHKPKAKPDPLTKLPATIEQILGENDSLTLSEIGTKLAKGWPELHKAIGKNKLKSRILSDVPKYSVKGTVLHK